MTTKHNRNEYFPWEPDKQNHKVKPKKIALSRIIDLGYTYVAIKRTMLRITIFKDIPLLP